MSKEYKITKETTPNKSGRRGWVPDMIVSHITEGKFEGAVSWLKNPKSQASAHFVVARDGRITQLVDIKENAWCNGTSVNSSSGSYYGKSSLAEVRKRATNANYYTVSIEHEGFSYENGGELTKEQFDASVWLHKHIIKEIKRIYGTDIHVDRDHIVGHFEIDPKNKPNCPGKKFPWEKLMTKLKESESMEKWQEEMGKKAIDSLVKKDIVKNPENWKQTLGEKTPQWLFWSIMDRITKGE